MKSLLLLPFFLLFSTSFKESKSDPLLLGTVELWRLNDNQVALIYEGIYPYCYMKYVIDDLYYECDTMYDYRCGYDTTFVNLRPIPMDSVRIDTAPRIRTKKL